MMLLFRSRHLALNSPLGHFNGDNAHFQPDAQNSRWLQSSFPTTATWPSLNYGEHNPSHVRRHTLPFSAFLYLHFVSILTTFLRDLQHKKQTQHSMLQIKTIPKNTFRLSASYFFTFPLLPYKLSDETLQRKHTHICYTIFLAKNISPYNNKNLLLKLHQSK